MRRFAVALALAAYVAGAPVSAALEAEPLAPAASVITAEGLGLDTPAQGFYPYFTGVGGTGLTGAGFGVQNNNGFSISGVYTIPNVGTFGNSIVPQSYGFPTGGVGGC